MVEIYKATKKVPLLTVHDELDFSNKDRKFSKLVYEVMANCVKLEVPLEIDYEVGPSWGEGELKNIEDYNDK